MAYLNKLDQKASARRHYLKNKTEIKKRAFHFKKKAVKRNRAFVEDFKKNNSCATCGESDPIVLEFDHIKFPKRHNISNLVKDAVSLKTLKTEIDKCQILCANCHRRKTKGSYGSRI